MIDQVTVLWILDDITMFPHIEAYQTSDKAYEALVSFAKQRLSSRGIEIKEPTLPNPTEQERKMVIINQYTDIFNGSFEIKTVPLQ